MINIYKKFKQTLKRMITEGVKTRKCRRCKTNFEPLMGRNGIVKSNFCMTCLIEKTREQRQKKWRVEKKIIKEKLKTHSDWIKDYQKIFNRYIRLRDKDKVCISCGNKLVDEYDAGHYFSVGAKPNLRFHEDNVHGQCKKCNKWLHGNVAEYGVNLIGRIGYQRFDALVSMKEAPLMLTIPEIKEKIKEYKLKIKHETR